MTSGDLRLRRIELQFAQRIDLTATLAPLGRSGDDLLDRWDGHVLVRTAEIDGAVTAYAGRSTGAQTLSVATPADGRFGLTDERLLSAVRATFITEVRAIAELAARDERVAWLVRRHPGVVPILFRDPFTALVRSISAQQINLRWAATIRRRLAERYGRRLEVDGWAVYRLEPSALAGVTAGELRGLQLTNAKARSVVACARAAQAGELELAQLDGATDHELIEHLTRLPGIGRWSAEWFLARTLGRPRVVAGDLGVRKAVGQLYARPALPGEAEVRRLTEHWGSAAAMAQTLALHELAVSQTTVPPRAG
jgi:DNA-3-methyladenine glycosylase II